MANVYGKSMTKYELLKKVGSMDAICSVRRVTLSDGRAQGLQAYEVINGRLRFTVYIDKCMDIGELYFDGVPLYFLARPGVMNGSYWYDGVNASRSIMCGMMFTCGLNNVGPVQEFGGNLQPQHGFMRNTPASLHGARTYWQDDDFYIELTGTMREAALFGQNIVLRRTITSKLGDNSVVIHDEIENENCCPAPLMLMYHCNAGYPLLDANSKVVADVISTVPRDDIAKKGMEEESPFVFSAPEDGYPEQVFYHKLAAKDGVCSASLVNPDRQLALTIAFDNKELPNLIHWKCRASGDYVTGLEPSNCHPEGINKEKADGTLRILEPGEMINTRLSFTVSSGDKALELLK